MSFHRHHRALLRPSPPRHVGEAPRAAHCEENRQAAALRVELGPRLWLAGLGERREGPLVREGLVEKACPQEEGLEHPQEGRGASCWGNGWEEPGWEEPGGVQRWGSALP